MNLKSLHFYPSPIQTITVGFGFAPNQLALTDFELLHHRRLGFSPDPEGYFYLASSYDNTILLYNLHFSKNF